MNPDTLKGWGVRENDWQWGVTLQQEIVPRMSIEVGYARRWWKGFTVTDNLLRGPDDYQEWTITAPQDSRLPNGGGYPIVLRTVTVAAAARGAQNIITFESDFAPERENYWHGVDVTFNARLRQGLTLQAGTSTGREIEDTCALDLAVDPNNVNTKNLHGCRDVEDWLTTLRGLASYTIPKVDVLVSATLRSQPPVERTANWKRPEQRHPGHPRPHPSGGLATGNTTITLLDNDRRLYSEERRTQIDMRFAKVLRFGSTRADVSVDVGNLLNTNYATTWENTYQFGQPNGGTWNNPTAIYTPRFVRLNFTVNFLAVGCSMSGEA